MRIHVFMPGTSAEHDVTVPNSATVLELKRAIAAVHSDYAVARQYLLHGVAVLDGATRLMVCACPPRSACHCRVFACLAENWP